MDNDLTAMSREELIKEIIKPQRGIRAHRDGSGHRLCWHHPDLWNLLPERVEPEVSVPPWPKFMSGCVAYRRSLDKELPDAPVDEAEFMK